MSIRTHIPWPNISGSYYKTSGGCCNKTTSFAEFSGLGTRDFRFTRVSQNNSCCNSGYSGYGYGYGYGTDYGFANYIRGGGCCGGGSNWFVKTMQWLNVAMAGTSLVGGFIGLFSSNNSQINDANNGTLAQNQGDNDGKVYRNKIVVTVTEETGTDGKKSYKVDKTITRVEAKNGQTADIVEINNPTNAILNDDYEVVFDTRYVYSKNGNTITRTIEQVPSADRTASTLDPVYNNDLKPADVANLTFGNNSEGSAEA